jgi:hypothetical protein
VKPRKALSPILITRLTFQCKTSYETIYETIYDEKCHTTYEKKCYEVGYGYHKGSI